jgi:hypothetical protein
MISAYTGELVNPRDPRISLYTRSLQSHSAKKSWLKQGIIIGASAETKYIVKNTATGDINLTGTKNDLARLIYDDPATNPNYPSKRTIDPRSPKTKGGNFKKGKERYIYKPLQKEQIGENTQRDINNDPNKNIMIGDRNIFGIAMLNKRQSRTQIENLFA